MSSALPATVDLDALPTEIEPLQAVVRTIAGQLQSSQELVKSLTHQLELLQ